MKLRHIIAAVLIMLPIGLNAQKIPAVNLQDKDGKTVTTESLINGKQPFAITFWASWCKFCIEELEALSDQAPDWKKPLRIYAVCEDDSRSVSRAKAMAAGAGWPATILYDTNGDFGRALGVSSIPHVFVFDKNGNLAYSHLGYIPGDEDTLVEKLLSL